jgi:hypothetical protein
MLAGRTRIASGVGGVGVSVGTAASVAEGTGEGGMVVVAALHALNKTSKIKKTGSFKRTGNLQKGGNGRIIPVEMKNETAPGQHGLAV